VVYDPACGCHSDAIRNRDAAAVRADDDRYAHGNADCDANINANADGHAGYTDAVADVQPAPL